MLPANASRIPTIQVSPFGKIQAPILTRIMLLRWHTALGGFIRERALRKVDRGQTNSEGWVQGGYFVECPESC